MRKRKDVFERDASAWREEFAALESAADIANFIAAQRANPEHQAHARLWEILNAAQVDAVVLQSPELTRFVWLMMEVLHRVGNRPGASLEDMTRPLETLIASARGSAGGRPPAAVKWEGWRRCFEAKLKFSRLTTKREIYEDIAEESSRHGHKPIKWTTVRDGISKLKKAEKITG